MGESGNIWELVKSNDLRPTKGSLYKGVRVDREKMVVLREGEEKRRQCRERS